MMRALGWGLHAIEKVHRKSKQREGHLGREGAAMEAPRSVLCQTYTLNLANTMIQSGHLRALR